MKKRLFTAIIFYFCIYSLLTAKSLSLGLNVGMAIPVGEFSDTQNIGPEFGGIVRIATKNPSIQVAYGVSYIMFLRKTVTSYWDSMIGTLYYAKFRPFSVFTGIHIGKEKGFYLLPAITGNFEEDWKRYGLDVGGGYLLPIGSYDLKLDMSAKFSHMNMVGKKTDEDIVNAIRIRLGLLF